MPPVPPDQVSPYDAPQGGKLLSARRVADRYGVHLGSISRWIARGVIPPPDTYINRVRFWRIENLDAADRRRTIERAATQSRPTAKPSNHNSEPPEAA